jgi:hypothetical protein
MNLVMPTPRAKGKAVAWLLQWFAQLPNSPKQNCKFIGILAY